MYYWNRHRVVKKPRSRRKRCLWDSQGRNLVLLLRWKDLGRYVYAIISEDSDDGNPVLVLVLVVVLLLLLFFYS